VDAGVSRRLDAGAGLGRGAGGVLGWGVAAGLRRGAEAWRVAPQDLQTGLASCTNPHLGHFVPNMATLPPARVRTIPGGGSLP
jgi:hypothetical protein